MIIVVLTTATIYANYARDNRDDFILLQPPVYSLSPPQRPICVLGRLGRRRKKSPGGPSAPARLLRYRVFSHDVTAAILVSQNNETAAMLVFQTNPVGVELFSYSNAF